MKKILILCFLTFFACSCASTGLENKVRLLEDKVAKLERKILLVQAEGAGATQNFYWRNGLEGGENNLDSITGMADGDGAMVAVKSESTTTMYFYIYKDPDTSVELNPTVIQPVSGTGRWLLCGVQAGTITSNSADLTRYISVTNTANPTSPSEGWIWYDTTSHRIEYRDNVGVKYISGITAE